MPITEKQLDALDKQHKLALQDYGKKLIALRAEEAKLTDNIRNMNRVIDEHIAVEKGILATKISDTEKLKLEAITMKKDAQELLYIAQTKTEDADKIYENMVNAASEHDKKVKNHIDTVSSAHSDIDLRMGKAAEKESSIIELIQKANSRVDVAISAEIKLKDKENELITINNNIKSDIEIQKDLYFKNKQLLDNLYAIKLEMSAIKDKSDADMSEAIRIRDDVDKAQAKIEKTSQEIIKRNDECKNREIQIKVTEQILKDRKSDLDAQEGRLNELKNNVQILLDKQQKQEA